MAGDTVLTIIGNLTADPELRFTQAGTAVCNFSVASTPRTLDRNTNEWRDGETLFMRCTAWKDLGEHAAESLTRGARVVVYGRLKAKSFTTREGEKRTVMELEVDEIGPSLRYATAKVTKAAATKTAAPQDAVTAPAAEADDPWGAPTGDLVGAGSGAAPF